MYRKFRRIYGVIHQHPSAGRSGGTDVSREKNFLLCPFFLLAQSVIFRYKTAKQKQVGAIMTQPSRPLFAERKRIVELAGKYRLPAIYPQKEFVDEGGLMFYGVDYDDSYRRAAVYVDKILKGAKPADLPVQQATKFEFVINLKAAKQIGLTIPVRVLERANQVIK